MRKGEFGSRAPHFGDVQRMYGIEARTTAQDCISAALAYCYLPEFSLDSGPYYVAVHLGQVVTGALSGEHNITLNQVRSSVEALLRLRWPNVLSLADANWMEGVRWPSLSDAKRMKDSMLHRSKATSSVHELEFQPFPVVQSAKPPRKRGR